MPEQTVHGGAFFERIGVRLDHLERKDEVVSADVLDAWYDPSPRVLAAVRQHLEFLIKTSPPTHAEGLRDVVAERREVDAANVLLGSGTSSLMFLALPRLVGPGERAVVLDPMYGEYAHILEHVVRCQVDRFELPLDGFGVDVDRLASFCQGAKLLVMVNPNSPTGVGMQLVQMQALLERLPADCRLWVDETYIDFMPGSQSLEPLVAADPRLVVCKSMSKFYGLSGLRVGYLVAAARQVDELSGLTPPWQVGLIGQLAAVEALGDVEYYTAHAQTTMDLAKTLQARLDSTGRFVATPTNANFVIARCLGFSATSLIERCQADGVFFRQCDSLSPRFKDDHVRIAVKGPELDERVMQTIDRCLTD
ncbi:MAG: histidinol-phosphate aminotransferase family protein [Armatimonadetes bacterium]|nr:histidinol-phosphate aminotransferase family protein [Armatimonadota bacterium]